MAMVRKQVFITADQDRKLKQRARAMKRPVAELIREAIDRELGGAAEAEDWKAGILAAAGALRDNDTIKATVAENRRRMNERLDRTIRKLRRED